MTAIFDVRITDTDVSSQRQKDPHKILLQHENEKKRRYLKPCLEARRQFTPLVFSVDGLLGGECKAAINRLASQLAAKWERPYSDMCSFVKSRFALALVRATTVCLRGSRDPTAKNPTYYWESGTGARLYQ